MVVKAEHALPSIHPNCWLGVHGRWEGQGAMPACEGQLRKCHLIPQQILKRELAEYLQERLLWDPAVWVWGCGGPMGQAGHHGHLDSSKKLRIPYGELPQITIIFARKYNLLWWVEREYKLRARPRSRGRSGASNDGN